MFKHLDESLYEYRVDSRLWIVGRKVVGNRTVKKETR